MMKLGYFIGIIFVILTIFSILVKSTNIGYVGESRVLYQKVINGPEAAHAERSKRALKTWVEEGKVLLGIEEEEEGWW